MTKFNTEATAIRELTTDELDLISGGSKDAKKGTEKEQTYLVVKLEECFVSSY